MKEEEEEEERGIGGGEGGGEGGGGVARVRSAIWRSWHSRRRNPCIMHHYIRQTTQKKNHRHTCTHAPPDDSNIILSLSSYPYPSPSHSPF